MGKQVFVWTYSNPMAFEDSKKQGLLGSSTQNAGTKGSIAKLRVDDLTLVRDSTQKNTLTCYGLFVVTGEPFETNKDAPLIWEEERLQNEAIFLLRVPVKYLAVTLPVISKAELLNLHWKKREAPFSEYKWQGISKLFSGNFLNELQIQQLEKLLGINFEAIASKSFTPALSHSSWQLPDEIENPSQLIEGAKKLITVNAYEREPKARVECIQHYGYTCRVCEMNFREVYGDIGDDFIHVHHLVELSSIREEYKVDPVNDLRPVCPNCHAMLHRRRPAFTIEEVKARFEEQRCR